MVEYRVTAPRARGTAGAGTTDPPLPRWPPGRGDSHYAAHVWWSRVVAAVQPWGTRPPGIRAGAETGRAIRPCADAVAPRAASWPRGSSAVRARHEGTECRPVGVSAPADGRAGDGDS